jgi:mannose-6-phosphate isomerase-like protein (cupin superfamily)
LSIGGAVIFPKGEGVMRLESKRGGQLPDAVAPDGAEVRLLCGLARGGLALFSLPPGAVAKPVAHRTVEELWFVVAGTGRIWRKLGAEEEITDLAAGLSLAIPTGTRFQFRCDGAEPLVILGATMPPWPGPDEAYFVEGPWPATL